MAHEFDSGMFVRRAAWHGLGNVLTEAPTSWAECRTAAGLDWDVVREPVFALTQPAHLNTEGVTPAVYREEEGWSRIARSDTNATLYIGPDSYHTISNEDLGILVDVVRDAGGTGTRFETAGALQGGRRVWVLMEAGEPFQVKGDPSVTKRYALVQSAHVPGESARLMSTNVRVVCANTWRAADVDGASTSWAVRHTANWQTRLTEMREDIALALRGIRAESESLRELSEELVAMHVSDAQAREFWEELFALPADAEATVSEKVRRNVETARAAVRGFYESPTCDGIRGTAYGLVQAAGEYFDHGRPYRSRESYMGRCLVSQPKLKARATRLAVAAAAGRLG